MVDLERKIAPLITQLSNRDRISDEERKILVGGFHGSKTYTAGSEIIFEGDRPTMSQLVVGGITGRYKVLTAGGRQITAVHIPGDFMDLHGFLLKKLAHGVVALTDCEVAHIQHDNVQKIIDSAPHLGRMLWLDTLIDASIHREWLVAMGRLPSDAQLAHIICEMFLRFKVVGLTDEMSFNFSITQTTLADIAGLSIVHVNRSVQSLRKSDLISWKGATVEILDWTRLSELAEFDPTYLCLSNEPR